MPRSIRELPRLNHLADSRGMRYRSCRLDPRAGTLMNSSCRTPPLASITRCDATFSGVVVISTYRKYFVRNLGKDERHRAGRVASPSLPRHNRVADVPKARRWQGLGARLPADADVAAEFAVPNPEVVARQPWHRRAVGSEMGPPRASRSTRLARNPSGVARNALELFARGRLAAQIIGRPAATKRVRVAQQVRAWTARRARRTTRSFSPRC